MLPSDFDAIKSNEESSILTDSTFKICFNLSLIISLVIGKKSKRWQREIIVCGTL